MQSSFHKSIDRIYRHLVKRKVLGIVEFCDELNLSPSTFYNYRKFLLARYPNVRYENQEYRIVE